MVTFTSKPFGAPVHVAHRGGGGAIGLRLGINLFRYDYFNPLYVLSDFNKQSSEVDDIVAPADIRLFNNMQGHYPAGDYTVLLTHGSGTFSNPFTGTTTLSAITSASPDDSYTLTVNSTDNYGIKLKVASGTPANVRLVAPGVTPANANFTLPSTAGSSYVHPTAVTWLTPFTGGIRMMEAGKVNGSSIVTWADRPHIGDAKYTGDKGIPYESMIAIANKMSAPLWLSVPHAAATEFWGAFAPGGSGAGGASTVWTNLANLIVTNYTGPGPVYLEDSNEPWNPDNGFGGQVINVAGQTGYFIQLGINLGLGTGAGGLMYQGQRAYARTAVEMFKVMKPIINAGLPNVTVKRILNVQSVQFTVPYGLTYGTLQYLVDHYGVALNTLIDGIAIAPYFPGEDTCGSSKLPHSTPTELLQACNDYIASTSTGDITPVGLRGLLAANAAICTQFGIELHGYEGGYGAVGQGSNQWDSAVTALIPACGLLPGMAVTVGLWLAALAEVGMKSIMIFASPVIPNQGAVQGDWGLTHYADTDLTSTTLNPKYVGVTTFKTLSGLS